MNLSFSSPEKHAPTDRRHAERRHSPDLAAYVWSGSRPKQNTVKDISSTGVYLVTSDRWMPGDMVSLTLQRSGPPETNFERRVAVQAQAIRFGDDGVGLAFVLPSGMDLRLWQSPLKTSAEQTNPDDILREFRLASALAFILRICPSSIADIQKLLREGLSNYRAASAVEIALKAERILTFGPRSDALRAPSNLVARILEDGSWADVDSTQQLWAGLLATCCTPGGRDESNLAFVSLLSQITATHLKVLSAACTKATKFMTGTERLSSRPITFTAQEITRITGTRDLIRVHRELQHLSDLGLLKMSVGAASFSPIEDTNVIPTGLGLQFFARCNGYRGAAQEFYGFPATQNSGIAIAPKALLTDEAN